MRTRRAFTLIELLVVISIIALLMGILLPALGKARELGRATTCLSLTRQWALGMHTYATDFQSTLPWDGQDVSAGSGTYSATGPTLGAVTAAGAAQYAQTMNADIFYGNAIPPYLGLPTYRQMTIDALANNGLPLPKGGTQSIWTCPSLPPNVQPYAVGNGTQALRDKSGATVNVSGQFLFSIVMNSKLNSGTGLPASGVINNVTVSCPPSADVTGQALVRLDGIPRASDVVLMTEIRAWNTELPASDITTFKGAGGSPYSTVSNNRMRSDWKRFANRHAGGGNVVMADGSGKFAKYFDATRTTLGDYGRGISTTSVNNTFNSDNLIWTPFAQNTGN